jgi:2-dehydro-3-deoxyphosphogluconate aldolase/(4S)-4-hydroxy-2-oxoglutarate aldolase
MTTVIEDIMAKRLVAIVRMEHYDQASEIARALLAGGISVIEFTLTGRGAYHAISTVREALDVRARIGVGTVLDSRAAEDAIAAGAQFVVTPVVRVEVIETCQASSVPILCGALTPTEALTARDAGADMIKIFPARLGGPQYIRDLLAPLPHLRLVPTGGISVENAHAYIEAGAVAVGVGGNLLPVEAVATGDWAQITAKAQSYVDALQ